MPVVVGVDSSTQSCTVEVRDLESGGLLGSASAPHPPAFPPSSEQDPQDWWTALRTALARALLAAGVRGADVRALAVDAQCHGLVALDEADRVVRPAKLWNDTTSAPQLDVLRDLIGARPWIRAVGSLPTAAFTVSKIAWLAENEPVNFARLRRVLLPHDWLTWRLTGQHVTDRSEASGTGYYDAAGGAYRTDVLELIDPRRDWAAALPRVLAPAEPAGALLPAVAAELGLRSDVLVGPGGGDQHASALGLGTTPGDTAFVFATSGVVFTTTRHPVMDESGVVDGVADMTGGYLPLVSTLNAARVTDTFRRLLQVDHAGLAELALAAPASSAPVLVPFFEGERKPNRPLAHGLLAGLTSATTREELARSAFAGVVLGLLEGEAHLRAAGVDTSGAVLATGGGARSAGYTQLLADLGGREVTVADAPEASARGACVQASAVARGLPVTQVLQDWRPDTRVVARPRPGSDSCREQLVEQYRRVASHTGFDGLFSPRRGGAA